MVTTTSGKWHILCSILLLPFLRQSCFFSLLFTSILFLLEQERLLRLTLRIRVKSITLIIWVEAFITVRIGIKVVSGD